MPYIDVIGPDRAEGVLKDIYNRSIARAGKVFNIVSIQSQNPAVLKSVLALYSTLMFGRSPLSRAEREMVAVVTSATNRCEY